jgi:hypothetical protein
VMRWLTDKRASLKLARMRSVLSVSEWRLKSCG